MKDRPAIPQDASQFLESNHRTFMITLRKDGSPTGHPMAGFFGGSLYMNMYGASVKAKQQTTDAHHSAQPSRPQAPPDTRSSVPVPGGVDLPAFRARLVGARRRLIERIVSDWSDDRRYPDTSWCRMLADVQGALQAVDDMISGDPT